MPDALAELENQIKQMQGELNVLRARTDLSPIQRKLGDFQTEIRLMHTGLLQTLKQMIVDLNAEGVKRYEGAVTAVTGNSKNLALDIQSKLLQIQKDVISLKEKEENQKAS